MNTAPYKEEMQLHSLDLKQTSTGKDEWNKKSERRIIQENYGNIDYGQRNIKCEKCDYKTSNKGRYVSHIKFVHEKIKNYPCDRCVYAAAQKTRSC